MTHNVRTLHAPPTAEYHEVIGRDDEEFTFYGTRIGHATSHREGHAHPVRYESPADPALLATLERYDAAHSLLRESTQVTNVSDTRLAVELRAYVAKLENAARPEATRSDLDQVNRYADRGRRCSACRWFECGIYVVEHEYASDDRCTCGASPDGVYDDDHDHTVRCGAVPPTGRYLVVTHGLTVVPGELIKRRVTWTSSAFEVIEVLTQRSRTTGTFLPATSARALAQAAQWDVALRDAYVNRAVA